MTASLVFVDTETTGLDPRRHDAWEIAVIRRDGGHDIEYLWQVRTYLWSADKQALDIGRYHDRFAVPDGEFAVRLPTDTCGETYPLNEVRLIDEMSTALGDAVLVGSHPGFDAAFLRKIMYSAPWHYRPVDVATLAAGCLYGSGRGGQVPTPYSSRDLSRAVGVEPPGDGVAHTALGDARWARDVYDAVTDGGVR